MKTDTGAPKAVILSGLLITAILLTSGCPQQGPGLEGTLWTLDSYVDSGGNLVSVMVDTEITAQFQEGTIQGNGGCNSYSADYHITGNSITIGAITRTLMYCTTPGGIMDQEDAYFAALASAVNFEIKGTSMEMTDSSGKVILVFKVA